MSCSVYLTLGFKMLQAIVAAFTADPLKALLGSGGIIGLLIIFFKWWYGRPKMLGSFLGETYHVNANQLVPVEVRIEIENLGRESTSILPAVMLAYRYPHRNREEQSLTVQENERTLAPVTPRTFTLKGSLPAGYLFSHFRVYSVQFTRGSPVRLRILNASGQPAGFIRFNALKFLFIVFGKLPHVEG